MGVTVWTRMIMVFDKKAELSVTTMKNSIETESNKYNYSTVVEGWVLQLTWLL